ncbi:MAG: hypothetical protein H7Z41_09250 [Cytophagales bacterium]|nr:hypothetical protein [Armatimonadota bacterium]
MSQALAIAPERRSEEEQSFPAELSLVTAPVPVSGVPAILGVPAAPVALGASQQSAAHAPALAVFAPPVSDANELVYRFPYCRSGIEIVPDIKGSFCTRLLWHKGKSVFALAESTPLRPLARVTLNSQRFDVFLNQHARKKRERILLAGRRKVAIRSGRAALRQVVSIEGREDRYLWRWRIGATAAAMSVFASPEAEADPINEVSLFLPFAPGKAVVLSLPGATTGLVLWMNGIAMSVVSGRCEGGEELPELSHDARGFQLTLRGARLGGDGIAMQWESWLAPARTEAEARMALLRHLADAADRAQRTDETAETVPAPGSPPLLKHLGDQAEAALMAEDAAEKKGIDRLIFRDRTSLGKGSARHLAGETVDTALAAAALMGRVLQTGEDALRRRARLLANGICSFQVNEEESCHWGAIWDAVKGKGKSTTYEDIAGERTLSVAVAARASKGLHILHRHFGVELYQRTALSAAQWLLLKMDRDGLIVGERFTEEGPPVEDRNSPWIVGEALIPLVETFRSNANEVFLKTALRVVGTMKEGLERSTLPFDQASTEQLAASIEGVLLVSREYEKDDMIALALQIGLGLRARRLPDGSLMEPPGVTVVSPLVSTLAGARAALALSRVDDDPLWLLFAYRALDAAAVKAAALGAAEGSSQIQIADQAAFLNLSTAVLLAVTARVKGCVADKDKLTITRNWQTFAPDPATRDYVRVFAPGPGSEEIPVDYLALVCPVSMQVLITVFAPPSVREVTILKNSRSPFVKNLLTGDYDLRAPLVPLRATGGGDPGANIGVFLADT